MTITHYADNDFGAPANMADDDTSTYCQKMTYVAVDLGSGVTKTIRRLRLAVHNTGARTQLMSDNPTFQGSNNSTDGSDGDWTTITTVEDVDIVVAKSYPGWVVNKEFQNGIGYRWYRLNGLSDNTNNIINEWEMAEASTTNLRDSGFNIFDIHGSMILSNNNKDIEKGSETAAWDGGISKQHVSEGSLTKKFYCEFKVLVAGTGNYNILGICNENGNSLVYPGGDNYSWGYNGNDGLKYHNADGGAAYGNTFTTNDIIGMAFDATGIKLVSPTGKIWWAKNNSWQASGAPASGANPAYSDVDGSFIRTMVGMYYIGNKVQIILNEQDFTYAPPTGFREFPHGLVNPRWELMASDGTSYYKDMVSASSEYSVSYEADSAFNNLLDASMNNRWISNVTTVMESSPWNTTGWYQWDFGIPRKIRAVRIGKHGYSGESFFGPHNVTFLVSTTGAFSGEEVDCGTVDFSNPSPAEWGDWVNVPYAARGRYFRLDINTGWPNTYTDGWLAFGEAKMYHQTTTTTTTTSSTTTTTTAP